MSVAFQLREMAEKGPYARGQINVKPQTCRCGNFILGRDSLRQPAKEVARQPRCPPVQSCWKCANMETHPRSLRTKLWGNKQVRLAPSPPHGAARRCPTLPKDVALQVSQPPLQA